MYVLGIYHGIGALLKKEQNEIEIVSLHDDVKQLDIPPGCLIVTGLETKQVVRREIVLPLKKEKEILSALPFQIESLIPYPLEQAILAPLLYPEGKVIVFATTESFLQEHLSQGLNPDIVSAVPAALTRYAAFHHKETKQFYVLHDDTALAVVDGKIAISQSFSPEEKERARAYILSKHGPLKEMENFSLYAVPIGLALEAFAQDKHALQFLQGPYVSTKEKKKAISRSILYGAASFSVCLAILVVNFFFSHVQESNLQKQLNRFLGESDAPLKARIGSWSEQLEQEKKQFPLYAPIVPLSDFLAWASDREDEINIVHLHYSLVKYPKMGKSLDQYQVKVDLELTAPSPTIARAFLDALRKTEKIVDTQKEIVWTPADDRYRTSFYLRNHT